MASLTVRAISTMLLNVLAYNSVIWCVAIHIVEKGQVVNYRFMSWSHESSIFEVSPFCSVVALWNSAKMHRRRLAFKFSTPLTEGII